MLYGSHLQYIIGTPTFRIFFQILTSNVNWKVNIIHSIINISYNTSNTDNTTSNFLGLGQNSGISLADVKNFNSRNCHVDTVAIQSSLYFEIARPMQRKQAFAFS